MKTLLYDTSLSLKNGRFRIHYIKVSGCSSLLGDVEKKMAVPWGIHLKVQVGGTQVGGLEKNGAEADLLSLLCSYATKIKTTRLFKGSFRKWCHFEKNIYEHGVQLKGKEVPFYFLVLPLFFCSSLKRTGHVVVIFCWVAILCWIFKVTGWPVLLFGSLPFWLLISRKWIILPLGAAKKKSSPELEGCFLGNIPSGKLTWQWKMELLKVYSLLKMDIFHCHVSLLEGNL